MAEAFFNTAAILTEGLEDWFASSAGIYAYEGTKASRPAVKVMDADYGIDISQHTSRMVSEELIAATEIVLCMTPEHRDIIVSLYPEYFDKVHTLKRYVDKHVKSEGITDPYGSYDEAYSECAKEIKENTDKLILMLAR